MCLSVLQPLMGNTKLYQQHIIQKSKLLIIESIFAKGKYKPYLELPWEKSIVQPKNMYNPRFNAFASIEEVAEWYKPIFSVPEKRIELLQELVDGACDAMINPYDENKT